MCLNTSYVIVIIGEIFSNDPQVMPALLNPRLSLEHTLTNTLSWRAAYKVNFRSILLSAADGFHLTEKKKLKEKSLFLYVEGSYFYVRYSQVATTTQSKEFWN